MVGILSNLKENGQYIGAADAGQDWHTDMSYRDVIGFVNVLYGIRIPRRDGKPLGGTEFSNMHAAYEALPETIRTRLANATVTHAFEKFWEHMRQHKNSARPPMTEEQRRRRPPVVHPLFLTHPITGRKVLYCNPGYSIRINELPEPKATRCFEYLYEHQLEAAVPLHAPLDGERFAGVGSHRNDPSGDRRLSARRDPSDAALPGDGDENLRSGVCRPRAGGVMFLPVLARPDRAMTKRGGSDDPR